MNIVTMTCVPCASPRAASRCSCQVSKERSPDREADAGRTARARAANAAAAEGSASRSVCNHRQSSLVGSTRSNVARVTQASPGLLRGYREGEIDQSNGSSAELLAARVAEVAMPPPLPPPLSEEGLRQ